MVAKCFSSSLSLYFKKIIRKSYILYSKTTVKSAVRGLNKKIHIQIVFKYNFTVILFILTLILTMQISEVSVSLSSPYFCPNMLGVWPAGLILEWNVPVVFRQWLLICLARQCQSGHYKSVASVGASIYICNGLLANPLLSRRMQNIDR